MKKEFLKIEHETEEEFKKIAEELMNNYAIQNHEAIYRLVEIEFYWNSPSHKDPSTYERKYLKPENGSWFFHYSGVDIALKNDSIRGYGGILIRAIYSSTEKKIFKGPMVCAMKLFSGTDAFSESIKTRIIEYNFEKKIVHQLPRKGLGNNAKTTGTDKLNYSFNITFK